MAAVQRCLMSKMMWLSIKQLREGSRKQPGALGTLTYGDVVLFCRGLAGGACDRRRRFQFRRYNTTDGRTNYLQFQQLTVAFVASGACCCCIDQCPRCKLTSDTLEVNAFQGSMVTRLAQGLAVLYVHIYLRIYVSMYACTHVCMLVLGRSALLC